MGKMAKCVLCVFTTLKNENTRRQAGCWNQHQPRTFGEGLMTVLKVGGCCVSQSGTENKSVFIRELIKPSMLCYLLQPNQQQKLP